MLLLQRLLWTWRNLVITKQDHIVIVGGPGNSLDRNHYYSVEKDVNFIAERTANTNVGLVNLFRRHNKP
jgi:hypothetical protein